MRPVCPHPWELTPQAARALQEALRIRVRTDDGPEAVRTVAGADVAVHRDGTHGHAAVVVYAVPDWREVERATAAGPVRFPYIPGLLSFREGPLLLQALQRLTVTPDVVLFDGHGLAHPRRFGLACHLAVLLDVPGIGVAKSRLVGTHEPPANRFGAWTPLRDGAETIGAVVRTRLGVRPVYVSVGHRVGLTRAVEIVLACCDGYRLPRPIREADHAVRALRAAAAPGSS